jgi:hypothetical protein
MRIALLTIVMLSACEPAVSWHRDVQPLVAEKCGGCHTAQGIAPFSMDGYADAKPWAEAMAEMTGKRAMPPWPPSQDCAPLLHPRTLSDDQIALIAAWAKAGAPEGTRPATPLQPQNVTEPSLGTPDIVVQPPEPYMPKEGLADDYHCFVVDPGLAADRDFIAARFIPQSKRTVHHIIVFSLGPEADGELAEVDAKEEGPGYTCFGGPGIERNIAGVRWLTSWAPGGVADRAPEGTGIRVKAGSKLVMQVHYNLLGAREPDQTQVQLYFSPEPVAKPARVSLIGQLLLSIPAGAADHEEVFEYESSRDFKIWGAGGHMHLLGRQVRLDVLRADGSDQCVLDIPSWDFHWQGSYRLAAPLDVKEGDTLRITCRYDNSAENQPFVNGVKQQPRDVTWGEGTLDEMCLGGFYATDP